MVAGKKELFVIYKVHSEGTPGFKTGGVECVIGVSGVSKHCYFLDQIKLYDGRELTTTTKSKSTRGSKKKLE